MSAQIFMIAGEASGDALGASLLKGLDQHITQEIEVAGIGGPLMAGQGMESLIPMNQLCVMGLLEIVSQLPRLIKLGRGIAEEIERRQPDVVVTIDLPDFNFRVAQLLRKRGIYKGKIVHYVAPSVWAWRPGRAKKIAGFLDGLMCLLPFEPPLFKVHGLSAEFVGHPIIEIDRASLNPEGFIQSRTIPTDVPCLGLFLGSRQQEIKKLGPIFLETIAALQEQIPDLTLIVPTLPHLEHQVRDLLANAPVDLHVVTDPHVKWDAMAACDAALAASGTIGLELAYLGIPHVIGYKMNPLTWIIVKALTKTKYAHLANIILQRPVIPEHLQSKCNPHALTSSLLHLLKEEDRRLAQITAITTLPMVLRSNLGSGPSQAAAQYVAGFLPKNSA